MFRIPWLWAIFGIGFSILVGLWYQLTTFFSPVTPIQMWLRLPWQAADECLTHLPRPPPLPDPMLQHLFLLLGSMSVLYFMPSEMGLLWHCLGLLACFLLVWSLTHLCTSSFPSALDKFSNTKGCPSWFVRPCCHHHSTVSSFFHERFHWHSAWSVDDMFFWVFVLLLHVGCFLGWLVVVSGLSFLLLAGNEWLWWCTGSHSHGCNSWIDPCGSLLRWVADSFRRILMFLRRGRSFLIIDIPGSLREVWATDSLSPRNRPCKPAERFSYIPFC